MPLCSLLTRNSQVHATMQIFNIEHPTLPDQFANPPPYCAQHFSKLEQPWGFKALAIPGHRIGYPVWLDINLSHGEIRRWIRLLDDGLFFDPATVAVTVEVVTYNAQINLFAKATVLFQSDSGGAFQKFSNVNTLKVCHPHRPHAAPTGWRNWSRRWPCVRWPAGTNAGTNWTKTVLHSLTPCLYA